jgi:hypothetical protein
VKDNEKVNKSFGSVWIEIKVLRWIEAREEYISGLQQIRYISRVNIVMVNAALSIKVFGSIKTMSPAHGQNEQEPQHFHVTLLLRAHSP